MLGSFPPSLDAERTKSTRTAGSRHGYRISPWAEIRNEKPHPAKGRRSGPPTSRSFVNWSAGRATGHPPPAKSFGELERRAGHPPDMVI